MLRVIHEPPDAFNVFDFVLIFGGTEGTFGRGDLGDLSLSISIYLSPSLSIYIYIYTHVYLYTYIYICICIYVCIYVYIYIYIHTYTHLGIFAGAREQPASTVGLHTL